MKISFSNKIAAAAAAGLISAACGGNTPEAEAPAADTGELGEEASELGEEAGEPAGDAESCKGEEGCEHGGECKGEEGCEGHAPE